MRRLIRDISSVLIISGLLLVLDAGVTLVWQEPVTALVALIKRSEINKQYLSFDSAPLTTVDRHALGRCKTMDQRIAFLARREQRQVTTGAAIGRIVISKIGASFDIIQGTDTASLEKGPGHYPATAFPGLGQTVAIAGHRTTYLAPFRHIDALAPGDQIVLKMPYARVHLRRPVPQDRAADGAVGDQQRRLRPPRAVGVQPALQRRAADHRVREAAVDEAAGPRALGGVDTQRNPSRSS